MWRRTWGRPLGPQHAAWRRLPKGRTRVRWRPACWSCRWPPSSPWGWNGPAPHQSLSPQWEAPTPLTCPTVQLKQISAEPNNLWWSAVGVLCFLNGEVQELQFPMRVCVAKSPGRWPLFIDVKRRSSLIIYLFGQLYIPSWVWWIIIIYYTFQTEVLKKFRLERLYRLERWLPSYMLDCYIVPVIFFQVWCRLCWIIE